MDDEAGFGLMYYGARWYDSALGRMIQADSVVPGGMQGLDRYAYANNSPVRYNDPTGHDPESLFDDTRPFGQGQVLQVNYVPIYQFDTKIMGSYSSETGYSNFGLNACGLVYSSYAGIDIQTFGDAARLHGYTNEGGIQPSGLLATSKELFGSDNVTEINSANAADALNQMFSALQEGANVGVDLLVVRNQEGKYLPSFAGNTLAHFARVLGIDFDSGTITLADSLNENGSTWTMQLEDFVLCWYNPEVRAASGPEEREEVKFWAIIQRYSGSIEK